jgi:hypothetical protein
MGQNLTTTTANVKLPTMAILDSHFENYGTRNLINKVQTGFTILSRVERLLAQEVKSSLTGQKREGFKSGRDRLNNLIVRTVLQASGSRLSTRFDFKTKNVREAQLVLLKKMIRKNSHTEFGRDHHFDQINSVDDFRREIEIQDYETLRPYIDRHTQGAADALVCGRPISYATTSGSTGKPKFIPITEESQNKSNKEVARVWTYRIVEDYPSAFSGKVLNIVSPAIEGYVEDGTPYGSTSGQLVKGVGEVAGSLYALPYDVFEIKDYETRYYCIMRLAVAENVTMFNTANPSTIVLLAKKGDQYKEQLIEDIRQGTLRSDLKLEPEIRAVLEKRLSPDGTLADQLEQAIEQDVECKLRPRDYWPNLAVIGCWTGGNSGTFLKDLDRWYPEVPKRDLGYLATEIRGSIPVIDGSNAGVLTIHENFFEFVDVDDMDSGTPNYLLCDQLVRGRRYYIFVTTKAGLYRYNINDIVEVKGFYNQTPMIVFVQKGKGVTSITGEKLYEEQLMSAINQAEEQSGVDTKFYMAVARASEAKYDLYVEFIDDPTSIPSETLQSFIDTVELALQKINIEYEAKRKSLRLGAINLQVLTAGSYEDFRARRIATGIRESQFKTTPLTQEVELAEEMSVLKNFTGLAQ